jgi:hypothetical protein
MRFSTPTPALPRWERGQKEAQIMAMHSIHVTALDNFGSNLSPCSGVDFGFFMNYPDIKV